MATGGPAEARGMRRAGGWLLLLPLGLVVAICAADILAPPRVHLGPLLVAAPPITAAFAGPRVTAAVGALAVAAQVVIGVARHVLSTTNVEAQLGAEVVVACLVVAFSVAQARRARELARTRSVANIAQRVLLRPLPSRSGPLRIASFYLPAEDETEVGGDLFAAARTATSTRLLIADVRGKGLAAYNQAALLLGAFRAAAHRQATLANLAVHLDGAFRWDLVQWDITQRDAEPRRDEPPDLAADDQEGPSDLLSAEAFATALLLDIPDHEPVVNAVHCGHPAPLLLRQGEVVRLQSRPAALPLGLGGIAGSGRYDIETHPFGSGDLLLLYTDGVTESRDTDGAFYPLSERVGQWAADSPPDLLLRVRDDLLSHAGGGLNDDAAAVAIRRESV